MKLMATILIPYDFRNMKLPSKPKKAGIKRSNSVADIRPSANNDRPDSARGPVNDQDKVSKWDLQKIKRQSEFGFIFFLTYRWWARFSSRNQ
jgi:hypothetical protein